jgi:ribosomal protein L32
MRHTSGHTRNRRSHHKLENPRFSTENGALNVRHRASLKTGTYRGRVVIDKVAETQKKAARAKARAKERGVEPAAQDTSRGMEAAPTEALVEKGKGTKNRGKEG